MKVACLLFASVLLCAVSAAADNPVAVSSPVISITPAAPVLDGVHYPHIHAAIEELDATIKELKEAAHDFGGHREDAVKACDFALVQLREAVKFANEEKGESISSTVPVGEELHPHIHTAIKELEATIKELKEAAHDFGGHRVDAIKGCKAALVQLHKAVKFADK